MSSISSLYKSENKTNRTILKLTDKMLIKKRGYVSSPLRKDDSVVLLLSGGLDSIGLWFMLMKKYQINVYPLYIKVGNSHNPEYRSIKYYEKIFKKLFPLNCKDVVSYYTAAPFFKLNKLKKSKSLRIDLSSILNSLVYSPKKKGYTPILNGWQGRAGTMIYTAMDYCMKLRWEDHKKIHKIVYGLMPEDEIFPYSELASFRLLNLALCSSSRDNTWEVLTSMDISPRHIITKRVLVEYAHANGIALFETWSCVRLKNVHCGECFNCLTRKNAFKDGHIIDMTKYSIPNEGLNYMYKYIKNYYFDLLRGLQDTYISLFRKKNNTKEENKSKVKINPLLSWKKQRDGIYILNQKNAYIDVIQGSAKYIWILLEDEPKSLDDIVDSCLVHHDISKTILIRDVNEFIASAIKKKYIIYDN